MIRSQTQLNLKSTGSSMVLPKLNETNSLSQANTMQNSQMQNMRSSGFFKKTGSSQLSQNQIAARSTLFKNHLHKLYQKNDDYFVQIKDVDKRSKKNIALDYKKNANSVYQGDFVKHPLDPPLQIKHTAQEKTQQPMELRSTQRVDYVFHKSNGVTPIHKPQDGRIFLPFAGVSSYGDQYQNWGYNPTAALKPPAHPTVLSELQFQSKTEYSDFFQGTQNEPDPSKEIFINMNKRGQFKSPLNPQGPLIGQTTNGFAYIPYKTGFNYNYRQNHSSVFQSIPTFQGQFKTIVNQDYVNKYTTYIKNKQELQEETLARTSSLANFQGSKINS